jgi:hypothetical protein
MKVFYINESGNSRCNVFNKNCYIELQDKYVLIHSYPKGENPVFVIPRGRLLKIDNTE